MTSESSHQMLMKIMSEDINTFNLIKSLPIINDINQWHKELKKHNINFTKTFAYKGLSYCITTDKPLNGYSNLIRNDTWDIYKITKNYFNILYMGISDAKFAELIELAKNPKFEQLLNFL